MTDDVISHYRACHLCEAICGVEIKTQGEQILSIKGDKDDPFSRGHICPKATALEDLHYDPDRLRMPMKKLADGSWQEIEWDEAFATVADRLADIQARYGNDTVAIYAGNPNVHNYGSMTHSGVVRKALQSRVTYSATSLDQLPHHLAAWAMYGHQQCLPIPDIDRTQFMLIIGGNPLASNGSIMTVPDVKNRLKAIQSRGGRFVVIDPRRTETAAIADEHLFIRPGSDVFLLMAMIHTLINEDLVDLGHLAAHIDHLDELPEIVSAFTPELAESKTGIPAATVRDLAREMINAEGAVCYGRMGASVQQFGALCQWAIQVINILSGNLDREGGALVCSPAFGYITRGEKGAGSLGRFTSRVRGLPEFAGELPAVTMAEDILTPGEGQLRAMMTIAGNPVLSASNGRRLDEAFESLDFMVSIDFFINETTRHADIILPPTGPLEHDHYDLAFNRLAVRNVTRMNEAVFEPAPGALHDWQIMNGLGVALAARKELDAKPLPAPDVLIDMGIQAGFYGEQQGHALALTLDKIRAHPHGLDLGPLQPSLTERLGTESGKIALVPDYVTADMPRLAEVAQTQSDDGLLLIGRRHVRSNNSWMHNSHRLVKGKPRWKLFMHPQDMAERNLSDDDTVEIRSRVGSVVTQVTATDDMMLGVVCLPHGWGHQRSGVKLSVASQQAGVSINDLTDDQFVDEVSGNAALNGVPVTVTAA
ncbi:dehydrogenase [Halioglobus japonicus]|uniref:Dehydrogenase n=1 Tax=Halioglobus japonicus TaxID=930805 RepID=A0AAP8SQ01_9GAMM|nr:molybdopterin-dependent oxidoreductase [Halioglobus japonicus]AQA19254.1 dehydrogenase [Halioglobus japonicus]PLW87708.1 dehydrogenase [Halioglobus japonicus]GHD07007.1 oxidoreductase [Halioglobus japonicus]